MRGILSDTNCDVLLYVRLKTTGTAKKNCGRDYQQSVK